jgi:hypothetical protein
MNPVDPDPLKVYALRWFTAQAYQHLEWLRNQDWDPRLWIVWALRHNLLKIWCDGTGLPVAGIIARPVPTRRRREFLTGRLDLSDPTKLLYEIDPNGDTLWVDFLFAIERYDLICAHVKSKPQTWVGWQHRVTGWPHLVKIADLPDRSVGYERARMVRPA